MLRVHDVLKKRPLLSIGHAAGLINLARPTVASALDRMEELGIIREITGQERNRVYLYDRYMHILGEGTAPLAR